MRTLLIAASYILLLSAPASAGNLLFILDSSGSMWGKVDGTAKIETAKITLSKLIGDIPPGTKVGLMAYGHREKKSCTDVEVLLPVGHATAQSVSAQLDNVDPKGKTPIAYALEQSAAAFVGLEKGPNNVVLISDGIETCDGDPCATAGKIAKSNINLRVHVVGFDISKKDRQQLECIAKLGKGKYFSADSTNGLAAAVTEAIKVAQSEVKPAPPPPPAKPARTRVFFDDFAGGELAKHWSVKNANPDAYVVENGKLLMFSGQKTGFEQKGMPNLITLDTKFPDGDWDAVVKFSGELKSGRDQIWVGLRKDEKNFVAASLMTKFNVADDYHGDWVSLEFAKRSNNKPTRAPTGVFSGKHDEQYKNFVGHIKDGHGTITLSKRGHSYLASLTVDGVEDGKKGPKVWKSAKLTSLRAPGPLTLGVSLWDKANGEVLIFVDSVEILSVSQ